MSKANATEAKNLIPLILRLIKEANNTAQTASVNTKMANIDASSSLTTAKEANSTVQSVKQVQLN